MIDHKARLLLEHNGRTVEVSDDVQDVHEIFDLFCAVLITSGWHVDTVKAAVKELAEDDYFLGSPKE